MLVVPCRSSDDALVVAVLGEAKPLLLSPRNTRCVRGPSTVLSMHFSGTAIVNRKMLRQMYYDDVPAWKCVKTMTWQP